jgi:hypothetical protein
MDHIHNVSSVSIEIRDYKDIAPTIVVHSEWYPHAVLCGISEENRRMLSESYNSYRHTIYPRDARSLGINSVKVSFKIPKDAEVIRTDDMVIVSIPREMEEIENEHCD